MTNIQIHYSLNFEIDRVAKTLEKLDWFNEQGYKITLPSGIKQGSDTVSALNNEYKVEQYEMYKNELTKVWDSFRTKLDQNFLFKDTYNGIMGSGAIF